MNKYQIIGNFVIVETAKGVKFLIDLEDLVLVNQYSWTANRKGYLVAYCKTLKKNIYIHRLIMNVHEDKADLKVNVVHHVNHITQDNRKKNLQLVSTQQNLRERNLSKRNKSGFTGVTWNSTKNKYQATIRIDGKLIMLGMSKDKEFAIELRKKAEKKYF